MKRQEILKKAKEAGIKNMHKKSNVQLLEELNLLAEKEYSELVDSNKNKNDDNQKQAESNFVLFKATSPQRIEGFKFDPYLLLSKDATKRIGGKIVNAVDFLLKSPFYKKKFVMMNDDGELVDETKKQMYTKEELLIMAQEQNIKVETSWSVGELYSAIFGASEIPKGD